MVQKADYRVLDLSFIILRNEAGIVLEKYGFI